MMKNSKKKGILIAVAVAVIVVIAVAAVCLNRKRIMPELSAKAGQSRLIKQKSRIKLIKKNQRTKEIQTRRL